VLAVLSGHQRYAHISALRGDSINPPLLGMSEVVTARPGCGNCSGGFPWRTGRPSFLATAMGGKHQIGLILCAPDDQEP
jgi:hypothetical protein